MSIEQKQEQFTGGIETGVNPVEAPNLTTNISTETVVEPLPPAHSPQPSTIIIGEEFKQNQKPVVQEEDSVDTDGDTFRKIFQEKKFGEEPSVL